MALPVRRLSSSSFIWALLGVLLLQAAWAFVVPPFRGLDEHDHAYKAAAVAAGDWSPSHRASQGGWGELLTVPTDLVVAASPVCESLPYTTPDNCVGVHPGTEAGTMEVASSAARYNPAFYFVIGTPARLFEGSGALYAMRATSALICALLIALAISACQSWSTSRWPTVAVILAATPVMIYSTAVAAPNGVEVSGAVLVWSALLALARAPVPLPHLRKYLVLATIGAVPLVTVRALGPLWLVLIVAVCALMTPPERRRAVLRSSTGRVCALVVMFSTYAAVAWTLIAGTNEVTPGDERFTGMWAELPKQVVLWLLQSVGAFPARNEPAPILTYAVALAAWGVFATIGWRLASRRERVGLLMVMVLATAVPLAVTIRSYEDAGAIWQGRYGYPFAVGFLLVCGHVLALRDRRPVRAAPVLVAGAVVAVAQATSLLGVLRKELNSSPLAGSDAWVTLPPAAIVLLSVTGVGALTLAALRSRGFETTELPTRSPAAAVATGQPRVAATQR